MNIIFKKNEKSSSKRCVAHHPLCQLTSKSKPDLDPILGNKSRPDLVVSRLFCNSLKPSVSQRHDNHPVLLESVYQISYSTIRSQLNSERIV